LGRLGPTTFLGGEIRLDARAAEKALYARVAGPLGMSTIDAAQGILDIAVTKMAHAVKGVTTARGLDAGNFTPSPMAARVRCTPPRSHANSASATC
jgi:N-methylhydantoinase A